MQSISEETRKKWEVEEGNNLTQIKFKLPTDFTEIFPIKNGEIYFYQIYVLGNTTNKDYQMSKKLL